MPGTGGAGSLIRNAKTQSKPMMITPSDFVRLAHTHFDYIKYDFGFIEYGLPTVAIEVGCPPRDGPYLDITAKMDTFWIRPASSHRFSGTELLKMLAPEVLKEEPPITTFYEADKDEARSWLAFWGPQLRIYGEPLLRGNLGLCEDMLITAYCERSKGWPLDDYFKIFRSECSSLPAADKEQLEKAMATRSPRQVYFLLTEWSMERRVGTRRLTEAMNDFRHQFLS